VGGQPKLTVRVWWPVWGGHIAAHAIVFFRTGHGMKTLQVVSPIPIPILANLYCYIITQTLQSDGMLMIVLQVGFKLQTIYHIVACVFGQYRIYLVRYIYIMIPNN